MGAEGGSRPPAQPLTPLGSSGLPARVGAALQWGVSAAPRAQEPYDFGPAVPRMPQNRAARPISLAFGMMACGAEFFLSRRAGGNAAVLRGRLCDK